MSFKKFMLICVCDLSKYALVCKESVVFCVNMSSCEYPALCMCECFRLCGCGFFF